MQDNCITEFEFSYFHDVHILHSVSCIPMECLLY